MSKFDRIAAFIAVVDENGFAAAARKNHVSTAAVSRQVTALEAALGAQLLQRSTRRLALTKIGEEYYRQCKKTLSDLQDAEQAIAKSRREATGILRIMANRYFADIFLFPKLPDFMRQNPGLQLNMQLAERLPNLFEENIDVLFGVSAEGPPGLTRKRVAITRYVLCASPAYLRKYGTPEKPSDLSRHRYITHSGRAQNNLINLKSGEELILSPCMWLNDSHAMCECAIRGLGIVNLHDYIVADALKNGSLIEILPGHQEASVFVYLYYQQSRYLLPKIRKFIDFYTIDG